ncbi:MAG: MFS transporter [Dehalococcoidia bacterium]|nr:MFS transporter [Dehalococcoidia bacterium]
MALLQIERIRKVKIFYGWWIVLAGTAMFTLLGAISYYGTGVFFESIRSEFGWKAAALGGALSVARVEGGVLAPLMGYLIDHYGPRKLMLVGVLVGGAGYMLLSRTQNLIYFYIVFILVVQGGLSAGMGNAPSTAIANWFRRKRSLAMGISNLGVSFGGLLARPLASVILQYGWRRAFLVAGGAIWVVGFPMAFIVRHKPEPYGYLPDGDSPDPTPSAKEASGAAPEEKRASLEPETEFSPRQALRTMAFWTLALMFSSRQLVTGSVALFLVPLLQERGMSLLDAAGVLSLMALIGMPGRVGFAWLGDKMDKRWVIAFCFVFQAVGLILFTALGGTIGIVFFLTLYSPAYSGVLPLIPAIQADYFGRKWFATIRGMMSPITTVVAVASPLVMTSIKDITGSYEGAFAVMGVANVLALVFILITRRPKDPTLANVPAKGTAAGE